MKKQSGNSKTKPVTVNIKHNIKPVTTLTDKSFDDFHIQMANAVVKNEIGVSQVNAAKGIYQNILKRMDLQLQMAKINQLKRPKALRGVF